MTLAGGAKACASKGGKIDSRSVEEEGPELRKSARTPRREGQALFANSMPPESGRASAVKSGGGSDARCKAVVLSRKELVAGQQNDPFLSPDVRRSLGDNFFSLIFFRRRDVACPAAGVRRDATCLVAGAGGGLKSACVADAPGDSFLLDGEGLVLNYVATDDEAIEPFNVVTP